MPRSRESTGALKLSGEPTLTILLGLARGFGGQLELLDLTSQRQRSPISSSLERTDSACARSRSRSEAALALGLQGDLFGGQFSKPFFLGCVFGERAWRANSAPARWPA
jgi:hypothetical protein